MPSVMAGAAGAMRRASDLSERETPAVLGWRGHAEASRVWPEVPYRIAESCAFTISLTKIHSIGVLGRSS
jgi:hypothetical protein